ncbi:MAG TPA: LamG domain-containing protein, partial [Anaerovoracaceae bacterium]|nr:LamG domain-containing protein [Anaerovoracaceae bacterium]
MAKTHTLDFELSSSQYASILDAAQSGLDFSGNHTFEMWLRFEQLPSTAAAHMGLLSKWGADPGYVAIALNTNKLNVYFRDASNNQTEFITNDTVFNVANRWYHVAIVATVATPTYTIYINGVPVAITSVTTNATSVKNSSDPFRIGAYGSTPGNFFDGLMSEVRVWNVARTGEQIRNNMFRDVTGATGLVAYWKLNNDYQDATANNNDLTPTGSPTFSTTRPFNDYQITDPLPLLYSPLFGDANLKSYYTFEILGDDSSPNNFDLTTTGSVGQATGRFGQGADFGSVNTNKNLALANNLGITNGAFSHSIWVKHLAKSQSQSWIAYAGGATGVFSRFSWYQPGKYITFYRVRNGIVQEGPTYPFDPEINAWYHLVMTYDGTTVRGYINGILVAEGASS